jgi:hypothetical protein
MLGTTEWLHKLWSLERYSAPQLVIVWNYVGLYIYVYGYAELLVTANVAPSSTILSTPMGG